MTMQYNYDRKLTIIATTLHIKRKYITQQIHTALKNFLQLYSFENTDFTLHTRKLGKLNILWKFYFNATQTSKR